MPSNALLFPPLPQLWLGFLADDAAALAAQAQRNGSGCGGGGVSWEVEQYVRASAVLRDHVRHDPMTGQMRVILGDQQVGGRGAGRGAAAASLEGDSSAVVGQPRDAAQRARAVGRIGSLSVLHPCVVWFMRWPHRLSR